jgi:hypothetical protein
LRGHHYLLGQRAEVRRNLAPCKFVEVEMIVAPGPAYPALLDQQANPPRQRGSWRSADAGDAETAAPFAAPPPPPLSHPPACGTCRFAPKICSNARNFCSGGQSHRRSGQGRASARSSTSSSTRPSSHAAPRCSGGPRRIPWARGERRRRRQPARQKFRSCRLAIRKRRQKRRSK